MLWFESFIQYSWASDASSADRRRTLDEERTDDFLEGVFSDASSADRLSEAVLDGVRIVSSSAEQLPEFGSSVGTGRGGFQTAGGKPGGVRGG